METPPHIEIAETFVRFYVLLSQHLDRCQDETLRQALPEEEFQYHLEGTREKLFDRIATNRVVKEKMSQEYQRIHALGISGADSNLSQATKTEIHDEREALRVKTLALSDLVAVYRSV